MTMHCGFELLREQNIPELNTRAALYRHTRTGAELLTLVNDDENKTFGVAFRTLPPNSTGVPHIIEHSVLGGSQKFPVKEPFVELIKGSLASFINAFTRPDSTIYPVASQNLQDLYNLMDVYLDAVFHPVLARHTFEQEGWHYELADVSAPLAYRGIVFNEMKGAMATPERAQLHHGLSALLPDTDYAWNSGGNPENIPDLTYEGFRDFYARYYHPSNARFFLYGDLPVEETLCRIDAALAGFEAAPHAAGVKVQPPFAAPRTANVPYLASGADGAGKAYVTVSWALAPIEDPAELLSLEILRYALIGSPASPLRKALIDSGLGEDLTAIPVGRLRQVIFSAGLKGVAPENAGQVQPLIIETLAGLASDGLSADTIAAALNTTEFSLRENGAYGGQRGIALGTEALGTWLYGGDPFALLPFEAPLAQIKAGLRADPAHFQKMIRQYLLDNPHRLTLVMAPDPGLAGRRDAEERARLDRERAAMSDAEALAIVENTQALATLQQTPNSPEALATLPLLRRSDLDKESKTIPLEETEVAGSRVLYHPLPCNGIVYLDLGFDLRSLPADALPYVTILGRALLETGTQKEDFVSLSQRIDRTTGGIHARTFIAGTRGEGPGPAWFFLRGKAMADQAGELLAVLRDVVTGPRLDNRDRLRQIVLEERARREAMLREAGHAAALGRLQAHFSEAGWAGGQIGQLGGLFAVRQLAEDLEHNWPAVLVRLEAMRRALVTRRAMLANVTLDPAGRDRFAPALADFLGGLPDDQAGQTTWSRPELPRNEGFTLPAQVNYVGKGADLYAMGYKLDGSVLAINGYLNTTWMWEKIRAQGGAYGGFVSFDRLTGTFVYLSYRDPNLLRTLDNYDATPEFLRGLDLSERELTKAIISAIGKLDLYQLPADKGFTSLGRYLTGETDERRQQLRDEVLSTTAQDFRDFAAALDGVRSEGHVVALGSEDAIAAAAEQRPGLWTEVTRAL